MRYTESEMQEYLLDNDVKFIKMSFCDIFGRQKIIAIQPGLLHDAFSEGIAFDASRVEGFEAESDSELRLIPDTDTLQLLPWRPAHGRVARLFCDIRRVDGEPFALDSRGVLKDAVRAAQNEGIGFEVGVQSEFYLFRLDETGKPTDVPFDSAGFMDAAPEDRGEDVRREICLTLEDMDVLPRFSHHSGGPGQNIIEFCRSSAVHSADDVMTYRSAVQTVAARNGLYASFHPKPIPDRDGSGFHISLTPQSERPETAARFLAGILAHAAEITALLNPTEASYRRLGVMDVPKHITWSKNSRRRFAYLKGGTIEVRTPDSTANPYLAYAALIYAGLDGVKRGLQLPEEDLAASPENALPASLTEALLRFDKSEFVQKTLPVYLVETVVRAFGAGRHAN